MGKKEKRRGDVGAVRHFGNRFGDFYQGLACGFFIVPHGQGHSASHALPILCWRDPAVFVQVIAAYFSGRIVMRR